MKFLNTRFVLSLIAALLLSGCAVRQPDRPIPDFNPTVFNSNDYVSSVDNFLIILDVSSSMDDKFRGNRKSLIAREIVKRLSLTLPELGQTAGLRIFGHRLQIFYKPTVLLYGMEKYTRTGLNETSGMITKAGGTSPMDLALTEAGQDFKGLSGQTAVIIITDGRRQVGLNPVETLAAALALKDQLKNQLEGELCFYPVLIAENEDGMALMDEIARFGECGFVSNSDNLLTGAGMAAFVRAALLTEKPMATKDSDNDGVTDDLDKCPGTPKGVKVAANGCLPVAKAAVLPIVEMLNSKGGWVVDEAYFEFDKAIVKPEAFDFLDRIAEFLKTNPEISIKIQGHTDSVGTKAYNDILSLQRARAVKNYLIEKGIENHRLFSQGFGYSKPRESNKTGKGCALNRRVELYPEK